MKKFSLKNTLYTSAKMINSDKYRYVLTLIFAESIALIAITSISDKVFRLALFQADLMGITNDNFLMILTNPVALLLTLFALILFGVFVILQLVIVINFAKRPYLDRPLNKKDFTTPLKKLISPSIFLMLIYIFVIMPNANMGVTSSLTANIHIPRFITDVILDNTLYTTLYFSAIAVGFYLNLRLLFTPIIFVFEDQINFMDSLKQSWAMTKGHLLQNLILILAIMLATFLITFVGILILMLPALLADFIPASWAHLITSIAGGLLIIFITYVISYASIFTTQAIVVRYQEIRERPIYPDKMNHEASRTNKLITWGVVIVFIGLSIGFYFEEPNKALGGDPFIVSHRGESTLAIENTLEALEIASTYKPDFVEMDVQLTKDGELVVYHDFTMKRLAHQSGSLADYTLDELAAMTLEKNGHVSRIPTFDEYVALAKQLDQPLMVELKGSSFNDPSFADKVIDVLKKYDMYDSSIFQSLDKGTMIAMKQKYPEAIVGYIIGFNLGGLENLPIDFYSIEDSSISTRVIADSQRFNKGLFVWTVNTEDRMELYLTMDVSGIITDDVLTSQDVLKRIKNYSTIDRIIAELQR